jgi:hypothetical protein
MISQSLEFTIIDFWQFKKGNKKGPPFFGEPMENQGKENFIEPSPGFEIDGRG